MSTFWQLFNKNASYSLYTFNVLSHEVNPWYIKLSQAIRVLIICSLRVVILGMLPQGKASQTLIPRTRGAQQ